MSKYAMSMVSCSSASPDQLHTNNCGDGDCSGQERDLAEAIIFSGALSIAMPTPEARPGVLLSPLL